MIDVAPLAGAWIEIDEEIKDRLIDVVAPLAGAWIEIRTNQNNTISYIVAPLAGAWIEITVYPVHSVQLLSSLPSRERGLKWGIKRHN